MIDGVKNFFQIVAAANRAACNGDDRHISGLSRLKSTIIRGERQIF
jgi:hypothetical protein